jgi:hypothetical protein
MIIEKYDTSLSLDKQLESTKYITENDVKFLFFKVKSQVDSGLKFYKSASLKNRTYRFYKGEYHNPTFFHKFDNKRDAYLWLIQCNTQKRLLSIK